LKSFLIILLLFLGIVVNGQDPQFSMFYSNSLYLAPSFAGISGQKELNLTHRTQWYSVGPYVTHTLSYDTYKDNINSGIGVLFLNDISGTGRLSTINISLIYDYQIKIKKTTIIPGMSFSYYQRSIDYYRLIWADQMIKGNNGNLPPSSEPISFNNVKDIDFSTSLLFYRDDFWGGVSIDHLLKPNESFFYYDNNLAMVPIKYQVFGGFQVIKKEHLLSIYPTKYQFAFLYKQQLEFKQLDLGMYYHYNSYVLGLWYRGIPILPETSRDAIVIMGGLKTKRFNIGYSYDFTISKLVGSTIGSHEVNLSYKFDYNLNKHKKKKMVPCPDF
jgi:type IX secretion system PorP/SprF family membrane protein